MNPLVSAIVLNFKTPQPAVKCVQGLQKQTIAEEMEVIVIDNHSEDDSIGVLRNRLKDMKNLRIVETAQNVGFGRGYNLAIAQARGTYLLLNNPAKILQPDALEKMVNLMESDPKIGIMGPKLLYDDGTLRDSFRAFPHISDVVIKRTPLAKLFPGRMRRYLRSDSDPNLRHDTDWVIGGCILMRRDLAEKLQGFDPRFFLFFEDIDLCRRAWEAGYRVTYLPEAVAADRKKRLSEGGVFTMLKSPVGRAHVKSAVQYFWKWRGAANTATGGR